MSESLLIKRERERTGREGVKEGGGEGKISFVTPLNALPESRLNRATIFNLNRSLLSVLCPIITFIFILSYIMCKLYITGLYQNCYTIVTIHWLIMIRPVYLMQYNYFNRM